MFFLVISHLCMFGLITASEKTSPMRRRNGKIEQTQNMTLPLLTQEIKPVVDSPCYGSPGDDMGWDTWFRVLASQFLYAGDEKKSD